MAWSETLVTMVRALTNDLSTTAPKHSDDDIAQAVATAAILVSADYPYGTALTIDLSIPSIEPDFSDITIGDFDANLVALIALRASCIIMLGDYQGLGLNAIRIKDGTSEVDTTGALNGFANVIKLGPCASYTLLLDKLSFRKGAGLGRAVLSPFSGQNSAPWGSYGVSLMSPRSFFNYYLAG